MSKTLGSTVREARDGRHMTREQVAKKLGITPAYLGHIERDAPVRISPKIVMKIKRVLGKFLPPSLVDRHNEKSRKWYRSYRKKAKASSKRT